MSVWHRLTGVLNTTADRREDVAGRLAQGLLGETGAAGKNVVRRTTTASLLSEADPARPAGATAC